MFFASGICLERSLMTRLAVSFLLGLSFMSGAGCSNTAPRSGSTSNAMQPEKTPKKSAKDAAATTKNGVDKTGAGDGTSQGISSAKVETSDSTKTSTLPAAASKPQVDVDSVDPFSKPALPNNVVTNVGPPAGVLIDNGIYHLGDGVFGGDPSCHERLVATKAGGISLSLRFRLEGPSLIKYVAIRDTCGVVKNPSGSMNSIWIRNSAGESVAGNDELKATPSIYSGGQLPAGDYSLIVSTSYTATGPGATNGDYLDFIISKIEIVSQDAKIVPLGVVYGGIDGKKID